jgi:hypothetical protein
MFFAKNYWDDKMKDRLVGHVARIADMEHL